MITVAAQEGSDRALTARAFIRARRRRFRPSAYQIYSIVIVGAIVGALGHGVIGSLIGGGVSLHGLRLFGPAVLLVGLLGAARFGRWQGPVSFSAADVALLLTAPIDVAALVRPKLDNGMVGGAAAGAAAGVIVVLLMSGGPAGLGVARSVGGVAGIAGLGLLAVAISWLVQSSRRSLALMRRVSPVAVLAAAGLVAVAATVNTGVGVWSGPWGWALAPLVGESGWPLATAMVVLAALGISAWARTRAGASSLEMFMTRAGTRSALSAAAFTLDYRGAALVYRGAQPDAFWRLPTIPVPAPKGARWAILWRDAVAMSRGPARCAWAAALCSAATLEALSHPGRLLPACVSAVALYFAAAMSAEPLRMEVDAPDRSRVLLGWDFSRLLLAHCVLPFLLLAPVAALTIAVSVLFGIVGLGALALVPTLLVPLLITAVLASALASRRGGRVDQGLLVGLLTTDPSNPGSAVILPLLLAPWLIAAAIADGAAIAIVGHAAAHHRPLLSAGLFAFVIATAAAVTLRNVARHSRG